MKRIIFLMLFLCFSTSIFAANVHFVVVNNGDVYNGAVYNSYPDLGAAPIGYTIDHVSQYFLSVKDYGARIKYPDGYWGAWQNARQGGWVLAKAGTYKIQGRVYVNMDRRGDNNYWMYSNELTFTVVDNYAPATPANFNSTTSNNAPKVTWTLNNEADISHYEVWRRWVENQYDSGWQLETTTTSNSFTDTDFIVWQKGQQMMGTVYYKVRAKDINNNVSNFSDVKSFVYSGTTWKRSIASEAENNIKDYNLFSNYPNPFNPTTQISYQIPKNSFVNLVVYNSLGQEVAKLVNQNQSSGKYSVQFNVANLPSGVYIYQLQAGEFNSTKKMLLTK